MNKNGVNVNIIIQSIRSDQIWAISIGGEKPWKRQDKPGKRIILFDEETGFTLFEDKMLKRRSNDISIGLHNTNV